MWPAASRSCLKFPSTFAYSSTASADSASLPGTLSNIGVSKVSSVLWSIRSATRPNPLSGSSRTLTSKKSTSLMFAHAGNAWIGCVDILSEVFAHGSYNARFK